MSSAVIGFFSHARINIAWLRYVRYEPFGVAHETSRPISMARRLWPVVRMYKRNMGMPVPAGAG